MHVSDDAPLDGEILGAEDHTGCVPPHQDVICEGCLRPVNGEQVYVSTQGRICCSECSVD